MAGTGAAAFEPVAIVDADPARARVYAHGWQSWSPTHWFPAAGTGPRPANHASQVMGYRPELPAPDTGYQGEGLLAIDAGDGSTVVFAATDGLAECPSIRVRLSGSSLTVSANGPVSRLDATLAAWADGFAARVGVGAPRPAPTVWCSWYHYFTTVTEADLLENLTAIERLDLPIDVVQVDDGWQAGIGDWRTLSGRFSSLRDLAARCAAEGRRAGIWVAPFLAAGGSTLAREHPDWLVADAGFNWGHPLHGLDLTHPGVLAYLREVFASLESLGFSYFKVDFLYAGALPGRRHADVPPLTAYRDGVRAIREAIGPEAYLLGCGAPILPSVGLFDAMRISADTAPHYEPPDGDLSKPGQRSAALSCEGRAFQHGRFWVNDPDCLIVRPAVERREEWAETVALYGGLIASSDRLADLDEWGLETTRRLLSSVPSPTPLRW
jgi:alpha-galactosidase